MSLRYLSSKPCFVSRKSQVPSQWKPKLPFWITGKIQVPSLTQSMSPSIFRANNIGDKELGCEGPHVPRAMDPIQASAWVDLDLVQLLLVRIDCQISIAKIGTTTTAQIPSSSVCLNSLGANKVQARYNHQGLLFYGSKIPYPGELHSLEVELSMIWSYEWYCRHGSMYERSGTCKYRETKR